MTLRRKMCLLSLFAIPCAFLISTLTQTFPTAHHTKRVRTDSFASASPRSSSQIVSKQAEDGRVPLVFITGVFGKVSPHMHLFLKSVRDQKFDVLVFGDVELPGELPSNVRYLNLSWKELLNRVKKVAQCEVTQKVNYRKVNDLKPLFGRIFENEIARYDMWGYGDNDQWIGDLTSQLTAAIMSQNDIMKMSNRSKIALGPGTFFRNVEQVNNLFRRSPKLCQMLSDHRMWVFDEVGKPEFGTSMQSIITDAQQRHEVRVGTMWPGRDLHWDGRDMVEHPTMLNITCELRCPRGGTCRVFRHCWPGSVRKCRRRELVSCHFQFSKHVMNRRLQRMNEHGLRALRDSEHVFFNVGRGVWIPNATELERLDQRGLEPFSAECPAPREVDTTGFQLSWVRQHRAALVTAPLLNSR